MQLNQQIDQMQTCCMVLHLSREMKMEAGTCKYKIVKLSIKCMALSYQYKFKEMQPFLWLKRNVTQKSKLSIYSNSCI